MALSPFGDHFGNTVYFTVLCTQPLTCEVSHRILPRALTLLYSSTLCLCRFMSPATVQALRRIAEESATSAKNGVFETTGFRLDADLRCELLGEALTSNLHLGNLTDIVARRTRLLFLYQCFNRNFDAVALHEL